MSETEITVKAGIAVSSGTGSSVRQQSDRSHLPSSADRSTSIHGSSRLEERLREIDSASRDLRGSAHPGSRPRPAGVWPRAQRLRYRASTIVDPGPATGRRSNSPTGAPCTTTGSVDPGLLQAADRAAGQSTALAGEHTDVCSFPAAVRSFPFAPDHRICEGFDRLRGIVRDTSDRIPSPASLPLPRSPPRRVEVLAFGA